MRGKLIKRWEEDATQWSPDRKADIRFARQDESGKLFCVYAKGTIFENAEKLIAIGVAVPVDAEVPE